MTSWNDKHKLFLLTLLIIFLHPFTSTTSSPNGVSSWNPQVTCWAQLTSIHTITSGIDTNASYAVSPFYPGLNSSLYGPNGARRWLTNSNLPGWTPPGPDCKYFVEIDNVARGTTTYQDLALYYEYINGHTPHPIPSHCGNTGWCGDFTFNICDMNLTGGHCDTGECNNVNDTTCTGRVHVEIDHDWLAAGYCGQETTCSNSTIINGSKAWTSFDVQGFVFWDPEHVNEQWHSFSGWELHPLTGIRLHADNYPANSFGGSVSRDVKL